MASAPLPLEPSPIRFGTDGWRGILGVDVTLERLLVVAAAAARELERAAPAQLNSREVVIGYDRRFLAPELAEAIASAVRGADLEPVLTDSAVPTPACSWAVVERGALGALVITASHNPPEWIGLKIKGHFGGSVEEAFTAAVEKRLEAGGITVPIPGDTPRFDGWGGYLAGLRQLVDTGALRRGLESMGLRVIVDPMHGSAAGGLPALLGAGSQSGKGSAGGAAEGSGDDCIEEIRSWRDP
ncbi:MAG: phosphoglucomutase/phosphomannomutase family protein, partial [Cyanobacteria bacterium]|nr:phosphoglucomutase/phosphomannomutase family protein [Cyanobacteriota bacterium]